MAIAAKKVSHNVGVVIRLLLLLLFSAASFSVHAHARTMGNVGVITQSPPWDDRKLEAYWKFYLNFEGLQDGRKYRTYSVMLRKRPDGEAMDDDKDARRRWYESFLPSTPTDSGEPRLVDCYPLDINGFLATLTRAEALALANKPGVVRRMLSLDHLGPYSYSPASCGFVTAITKRNVVRSRPAL